MIHAYKISIFCALMLLVVSSASMKYTRASDQVNLTQSLQSLINQTLNPADPKSPIHGVVLHVEAPGLDLSWTGVAGSADPEMNIALTARHPMRIASNTKTYVAAAILRLWEEGHVELDTPIIRYISDEHALLLKQGSYDPNEITVHHLLTHRSGIFNSAGSSRYHVAVSADFFHRWTRTEQLRFTMTNGEPYGSPGKVYRYSDTGYILLGEIIERIYAERYDLPQISLGWALRDLLKFETLGLNDSWWEQVEPRPEGTLLRAHQFIGQGDFYFLDASADLYGGGGLVSTMSDMARFYRALFTGGVFNSRETEELMLTAVNATVGGSNADERPEMPGTYKLGIYVEEEEGMKTYSHSGSWGTKAVYIPELDIAISLSVTQRLAREEIIWLYKNALNVVRNSLDKGGS